MNEMSDWFNSNTLLGLIAALFGGIGVKIFEKFLSRKSENAAEAREIREELRKDLSSASDDAESARLEADNWRSKYWTELENHTKTKLLQMNLLVSGSLNGDR